MIGSKRSQIIIIGIILVVVIGVITSLLIARQKAHARFIIKSREADSLSFVAMALQKQMEVMVGLGNYGIDTVWAPPDTNWLPQDTAWIPGETIRIPAYVPFVSFDTTSDFKFNDWAFGVRVKGKFACGEEYRHLNYLSIVPTYWKRPPPMKELLEIDTNLLQNFGFGIAAINTAVGLSGRYNRTTITIMRDLRKGGGWRLGGNVEFWRF